MLFFKSVADLMRAVERGRLQAQDQVYVSLGSLHAVSGAEAEAAERAVVSAGARFHPMVGLARIVVLSIRELNEGFEPPGLQSPRLRAG